MHFIVSTVGTSILTNSIDRDNQDEARNWARILGESANLKKKEDELPKEAKSVIDTLAERATKKLSKNDVEANRRASAELNGIYGFYEGRLPENSNDQHYLVCTDTFQGQTTGNLIAKFLKKQGFTVSVVTPGGLSTKDTDSFTGGTKVLIKWLEDNVQWRRDSGYRVIFNLVGGFKSLQGYMQTFGTFYADETVYIFERSSDLIKIPRLPIQIDTTVVQEHRTKFAMMAADEMYPIEELEGIPETLLEPVTDDGNTMAGLSAWGELIWNRTKSDLLAKELLPLPRLTYAPEFISDIDNKHRLNNEQRVALQETLVKIAVVLENSGGDITQLNKEVSGLGFENFRNHDQGFYRFRITLANRVSCQFKNRELILIHCGPHEYVDAVSHSPYCTHC